MLKRIVHPSAFLVTFVTLLHLNLSKPQRKHLLRTADAIIVCEGRKTLANLYRQWVEAPDASAVADGSTRIRGVDIRCHRTRPTPAGGSCRNHGSQRHG